MRKQLLSILICGFMLVRSAHAEVVAFDVRSAEPAFGGRTFGNVGAYEIVRGIARYRVDPAVPVNAGIVNIRKAPKEADGRIAFDADVTIIKPVDLRRGNRRVLYEMVNRGRPLAISTLNRVSSRGTFDKAEHAGDGLLMELGYTVVMSGWQAEYPVKDAPAMSVALGSRLPIAASGQLMSARLPIGKNADGTPLTDVTREQFFDVGPGPTFVGYLTYPAADQQALATLTMRERDSDPLTTPSGLKWRYIDEWRIEVTKPAHATAGAVYQFVYRAKDPVVYGLALASMRDLVSYIKHDESAGNPFVIDGKNAIDHVIGVGASQTGRTLKELVSEFNEDEAGRQTLDGAFILISGAGRNSINSMFARPGLKDAHHTSWGLRGDEFPFSYPVTYDHLTRRSDGVLSRCLATRTCPKIIHADSENELWHGGTLTYVDSQGRDLTMPDTARVFAFAGTEHSANPQAGMMPPFCAVQRSSQIEWSGFARALFVALDEWIVSNRAPPASEYPTVARGELVPLEASNFPVLPAMKFKPVFATKYHLDFDEEPPARIAPYPALVPKSDRDGVMTGGVRHPFVTAPLATNVGWNPRKARFGEGALCMASGMSLPFAATREQRITANDPRLSIEERYATESAYVAAVERATRDLVSRRLLLKKDADALIAEASSRYRAATASE